MSKRPTEERYVVLSDEVLEALRSLNINVETSNAAVDYTDAFRELIGCVEELEGALRNFTDAYKRVHGIS